MRVERISSLFVFANVKLPFVDKKNVWIDIVELAFSHPVRAKTPVLRGIFRRRFVEFRFVIRRREIVFRSPVGTRIFRVTFDSLILLEICDRIIALKNNAVLIDVNFWRFGTRFLRIVSAWARSGSLTPTAEIEVFASSASEAINLSGASIAANTATQVATKVY